MSMELLDRLSWSQTDSRGLLAMRVSQRDVYVPESTIHPEAVGVVGVRRDLKDKYYPE